MTTQAQSITTQVKVMKAQENREVAPYGNKNFSTVVSLLRESTRINPPMFIGSKVDEYPQLFLDEFYKILNSMGVS